MPNAAQAVLEYSIFQWAYDGVGHMAVYLAAGNELLLSHTSAVTRGADVRRLQWTGILDSDKPHFKTIQQYGARSGTIFFAIQGKIIVMPTPQILEVRKFARPFG